LLTLADPYPQ